MSMFRYPGGKYKLRNIILEHLRTKLPRHEIEYREPFFGGGSIGLTFLADNLCIPRIWLNDKDTGIASLWTAVMDYPEEFKNFVRAFKPSVAAFDEYKEYLLNNPSTLGISYDKQFVVECGFRKLAIHQMSYSGLGTKAGGPIGGKTQEGKTYQIDCRYNPDYICKKIDKYHNQLSGFQARYGMCSNLDFEQVVRDNKHPALLYLDPPYCVKGNELYQFGFEYSDHVRLALSLKGTDHAWLLSYDDCPEIRDLYNWAHIIEIDVNYTIRGARTKGELLIMKKEL